MSRQSLSQRLKRTMIASTVVNMVVSYILLFAAYALLYKFAPKLAPTEIAILPNHIELAMFSVILLLGVFSTSMVTTAVARRLVLPLAAVAEAARRIAGGDLAARAAHVDGAPAEPTQMVSDFNLMADRLERAVEDIVTWNSVIAHELRTPVTILKGRLQGLAEGVFEPEPALLQSLHVHADGLARLVEDLRVVTLLDSGHLKVQPAEIDLADEIHSLAQLVERDLQKVGFDMIFSLEARDCLADKDRLRQALLALIDNAMKYAWPCVLELRTRRRPGFVEISLIDMGPGMPEGFADRAFEPFRRADDTDSTPSGSGLGLAVVRGVAEAHGGYASYEQVEGRSVFSIGLPAVAGRDLESLR